MNKHIYMLYDIVAATVIGGIIIESADAPAIRSFHDALQQQGSLLALHPNDYELRHLGMLLANGEIIAPQDGPHTVATGAQWAATQYPTLVQESK